MREITDSDKLFYFENNFFAVDGVWMLETEKEVGWDLALKIDTAVWTRLLKIFIQRIKHYLKIDTNTLADLIEIITFRWSIEGWNYEVIKNNEFDIVVNIIKCPYKTIMERTENRQDKIPFICKNMCKPFYKAAFKDFNPDIKLERKEFMGLGNHICDFHFKTIKK
ncbi:MAG: DUF6125 family protein [Promethearchaeota archaeon]